MRAALLLIPIFLLARENPFFLPNEKPAVEIPKVQKVMPKKVQKEAQQPKKESKVAKKTIVKTIQLPSAKIEVGKDFLRIYTSNKIKQSFFVTDPDKLVIDVVSNKDFPTIRKALQSSVFTQIVIGAHKNYFRIALKLAKQCSKEVRHIKGGYEIYCH